ncbi:hypothetical protein ACFL30_00725 [Candidatus Latescibacterota bacterium]
MTQHCQSFSIAQSVLRKKTGIVIPVYFPESIDLNVGKELLDDTVASFCSQVDDPENICLSIDGENAGTKVIKRISAQYGVSHCIFPDNRGKLHAIGYGMRYLFERKKHDYIAVVDQDGDHFAHELINFLRAALFISGRAGDDRILVLGRRISRHRPMGFLRGELEELADRVLLDALYYHAAVTGSPLRMEIANVFDEYPDFHSGYKLFSVKTAHEVFLANPEFAGVPEDSYYRHAVEAVLVVEALESGAYLGVVNRTTINEQQISTFGLMNRIQLVADKIIWPCKRLKVPLPFVEQWLANHIPRLLLHTFASQGKDELLAIRKTVLEAFGKDIGNDSDVVFQPPFV